MKDPNSQQELSQPKTWKDVINVSNGSFREDTNRNISSEQDIVSLAAEESPLMNVVLAQEIENCPVELMNNNNKAGIEAEGDTGLLESKAVPPKGLPH